SVRSPRRLMPNSPTWPEWPGHGKVSRMPTNSTVTAMSRNGAAILGRLIDADAPGLDPEAARWILKLSFPRSDKKRVADLLAKNQEGQLGADDRAELDEYLRVDAFLSVLKSKARLSLRRAGLGR